MPDAEVYNFKLQNGFTMAVECSPAGLIGGRNFLLDSGAVLRFERRVFETQPGLSSIDDRIPRWWDADDDAVRSSKTLMVAMWNGMLEEDRVLFLSRVVDKLTLRRAAA